MSIPGTTYIGRFAPTPSGYLHFGSLMAALASYLDARSQGGRWLLRMEDLDPPREMPGAQSAILTTLENYGFEWDGELIRQSDRLEVYSDCVEKLLESGLAYPCDCSRKKLAGMAVYPGYCRERKGIVENAAIRLKVPARDYMFTDRVQGVFRQNLATDVGDFVIRRRDGLFAYQLAVVIDDAWQQITDVVRGADLLDSTPRQLYLQDLLGLPHPRYLHVPLIVQPDGHKLGKRYRSPPLPAERASPLLLRALRALGQQPDEVLLGAPPGEIMAWANIHWNSERIPRVATLDDRLLGC